MFFLLAFVMSFVSAIAYAKPQRHHETSDPAVVMSSRAAPARDNLKKIYRGNMEVSGSFGLGYSPSSGLLINARPRVQYFIFDYLSLGGSIEYDKSNRLERTGVGPSVSYYFWDRDRVATFFGQSFVFSKTSDTKTYNLLEDVTATSTLGLNYFFSRSVALGLSLNYVRELGATPTSADESVVRGEFSFYF